MKIYVFFIYIWNVFHMKMILRDIWKSQKEKFIIFQLNIAARVLANVIKRYREAVQGLQSNIVDFTLYQ